MHTLHSLQGQGSVAKLIREPSQSLPPSYLLERAPRVQV